MRYSQKSDFLGGNYRDLLIKLFCINEVTQPFGFLTLVNIKLSDIYRPSKMNFYWYGKHGWEKYFLNLKMWSKCLISYRTGPSRSWRSLTSRIHPFYTIILKRKSPYHKILRSLKCQVIKNITFEDFQVDFDRFWPSLLESSYFINKEIWYFKVGWWVIVQLWESINKSSLQIINISVLRIRLRIAHFEDYHIFDFSNLAKFGMLFADPKCWSAG